MKNSSLTPFNDWGSFIHDQAAKATRDERFEAAMEYAEWESRQDAQRPACKCGASTGIHEGLTFGFGKLDPYGYWEHGCSACARWHETQNGVPLGTYWPFPKEADE